MSGPSEKVFLNGKIAPFSEAVVSIYTIAFRFGATVFEGLRSYWNEAEEELFVFRLQDHSRRLEESVKVMRMDTELAAADFSAAVLEALEAITSEKVPISANSSTSPGPARCPGRARSTTPWS